MKKYTVDDLIIEVPEKENKKGNPKPKGKFLTGIIIVLALITIALLMKDSNSSPADDNASQVSKEKIEVALDESSLAAKAKKEIVKNDDEIGGDTRALLDQIVPLEEDNEKKSSDLTLASNDAESLLPAAKEPLTSDNNKELLDVSIGNDLLTQESKKEVVSGETAAVETKEPLKTKEKATQATEEEKPADTGVSEGIKEALETPASETPLPEANKKDTVAQSEAAASKTQEAAEQTAPATEEPEKISDILPTLSSPEVPAAKVESAPEPEKPVEKTETKPEPEQKESVTPPSSDLSTYYIQVGVFNMEPTEKFLSKLKNAGLSYVVLKSGKTRRVRVGPYRSLDRANQAITQIDRSTGIKGFAVKTGTPKKSEIETASKSKPAAEQTQSKPKEKEKKTKTKKEKPKTTAEKKPGNKTTSESKPKEKTTAAPKKKPVQRKAKPTRVDPLNLFTQKNQYRYYVHIGTFRGNPPASFLKKLRRAGVSYSISKSKGRRSVLVGPYRSYQSAKSAVGNIGRKAGIKGQVVKAKR